MEPNCLLVLRFGGGRPWWTALHSRRFSQPVTVYRMHSDDSGHSKLIVTTREAYDDLMETRAPAPKYRPGKLLSTLSCERCSIPLPRMSRRGVVLLSGYTTHSLARVRTAAHRPGSSPSPN